MTSGKASRRGRFQKYDDVSRDSDREGHGGLAVHMFRMGAALEFLEVGIALILQLLMNPHL